MQKSFGFYFLIKWPNLKFNGAYLPCPICKESGLGTELVSQANGSLHVLISCGSKNKAIFPGTASFHMQLYNIGDTLSLSQLHSSLAHFAFLKWEIPFSGNFGWPSGPLNWILQFLLQKIFALSYFEGFVHRYG